MARSLMRLLRPVFIVAVLLWTCFPVWWMAITSIKTGPELYTSPNPLWPQHPTLDNFRALIAGRGYLGWLGNSLMVSAVSSLIAMCISLFGGYAIARIPSVHSRLFGWSSIIGYSLAPVLLFVPMFLVATTVGSYDRLWFLCLVYPTFLIPFASWLLAGYLRSLPRSLEDAARVDGCGRFRTLVFVLTPSIRHGAAATLAFCFLLCWGEYIYAFGLISSGNHRTVPVGLALLESGDVYVWGEIMAGALLASVPAIALLGMLRHTVARGISLGGSTH